MANLNELFQQQVANNPADPDDNEGTVINEEPELVTEDITFDNEVEAIEEVETALESLSDLYNNMVEQGGLSRQLVLECLEIMPEFDGKRSINNYSSTPTNLRYKVAMEELSKGMMAAIAAGIAVVVAIIAKLMKWLWPKKGGGGGSTPTASDIKAEVKQTTEAIKEKAPEVVDAVSDVNDAIKELAEVAHKDETVKKSAIKDIKDLDTVISLMYKTGRGLSGEDPNDIPEFFKELAAPITYDIMTFGPWTKNMHEVLGLFKDGSGSLLVTQVKRKLEAFKANLNNIEIPEQFAKLEEEMNKPLTIKFNGAETPVSMVAKILSEQREALKNDKTDPKKWSTTEALISAKKLNDRGDIINGFNSQAAISLELLEIEDELEKFKNTKAPTDSTLTDETNANRDAVLAKFSQKLYSVVRGHVLDVSRLTIEVKDYTSSAAHVVSQLADISIYAAQQYAQEVKHQADNPAMTDILKAALKKITELGSFSKAFKESAKPRRQK